MSAIEWDDLKPGEFFAGGPRHTTPENCRLAREILAFEIGNRGAWNGIELCHYRSYNLQTGQPKGMHACTRAHMLEWSVRKPTPEEKARMTFWKDGLTEEEKRSRQKRYLRTLLSQETFIKRLSKLLVVQAFRNGPIEDIHAGEGPSSKTGDFTDVKVVSPYGEIPWAELSRITDDEMRGMMIRAVNMVFTILWEMLDGPCGDNLLAALFNVNPLPDWNEPEIVPGWQKIIREELSQTWMCQFVLNGPIDPMRLD